MCGFFFFFFFTHMYLRGERINSLSLDFLCVIIVSNNCFSSFHRLLNWGAKVEVTRIQ